MERDPDTAAKVQGVLFQILSVTRKLSASENRTEKKVGGGWYKVKYTQNHRGKEKSAGGVTRIQCRSWTSGLPSGVRVGPRSTRTYFS